MAIRITYQQSAASSACLSDADQERIAEAVHRGELVVLPTDTVYGVGCDAQNPQAVERLLAAKGRGPDMPVPILVPDLSTAEHLAGGLPPAAQRLAEAWWPGPLSLVVPHRSDILLPVGDTHGTILLRIPQCPVTLDILREVGPMAVSSANKTGHPPALTSQEAYDQLGETIAIYVDGGTAALGEASTIVECTSEQLRVLREGALSLSALHDTAHYGPAEEITA